jgi:hypothetical protein
MSKGMFKKCGLLFCALVFVTPLIWAEETINLSAKTGQFIIDPATLAISVLPVNGQTEINLTQGEHRFDAVKELESSRKDAQWHYPHLKIQVKVAVDEQGLKFLFISDKAQSFQWPMAGLTSQAKALILPDGEGLYIPNHDPFWLKEFNKYPKSLSLSMPFWAIEYPHNYVSYILADKDENTDAQVQQRQGQLYLLNTHHFLSKMHLSYEVFIHLTGNSPISPAVDYRNLLIEQNKFVSLKQKILENANVNKLLGAFHIWVWGDGKSLAMLDKLDKLGIKHALINYNASPVQNGFNVDKDYVHMAESMGYLIGPYDNFDNAVNPKKSDNITLGWPKYLWPEACIRDVNGSILTGYANRGCYLSSEALRLRESKEKNIANHIEAMLAKGDNSLFLDYDAAYPLYEDYSKQHPMTSVQDLNNRLERMRYISSTKKLVLGSERGLAWSAGVIAYNNGAFLTFSQAFWPIFQEDKKQFRLGWPIKALRALFKPYNAPDEFIHANYNPRYRLPLYEVVFHDSVISTDRSELSELKILATRQVKALLQNLYNIPPIWVLDKKTLDKIQNYFSEYYNFFSPLHQMAGLEALTQFEWLTDDRLVQRTQFGNRVMLTANFSNKLYEEIAAHCIQAEWKEDGSKTSFCPKR